MPLRRDPPPSPTSRPARGPLAVLVAVTVVLAAACGTGGGATTAPTAATAPPDAPAPAAAPTTARTTPPGSTAPAAPRPVQRSTITLVDRSRPTEAGAQTPARPERTLETTLFVPDGAGPYPLIVFSHGLSGHPSKFSRLLTAWAAAGFVVAAPAFPLTNDTVPASSQNWAGLGNQPADVRFVIDQVLAAGQGSDAPLGGKVDAERIGAGGLSLGGATTYGVTFHDCCRDPRIDAAEVLSGARLQVSGAGDFVLDGHVPLLIVHGDQDLSLPYDFAVQTFELARPPVWFVTLLGGSHAPPFEDTPSPWDELDEQITTDFWLGTLGGDADALARVSARADAPGLATIRAK